MIPSFIARGKDSQRFEKIPLQLFPNPKAAVDFVAKEIADLIREKQSKNENCVLGLATGPGFLSPLLASWLWM